MIDALIFSRDRPAQLDLLLYSIEKHASHLYRSVTVLWTIYGDPDSRSAGYELCCAEHEEIVFVREREFEQDTRAWLSIVAGDLVSFLVDDDVFYRDAGRPERLPWSYRGGDYDYPFSVDGNVYDRDAVVGLLDGLSFSDPTRLEAGAHTRAVELGWPSLEHDEPCLVGIPANRVSPSSGMPHMGTDLAELNRRFLAGDRLSLERMDFSGVSGSHEEIAYAWERNAVPA